MAVSFRHPLRPATRGPDLHLVPSPVVAESSSLGVVDGERRLDPEMNARAVALCARGLGHVYRGPHGEQLTALENLWFDVREGEFVSIVGPSGCGKTTLLRILADLIEPTSGETRVLGMSPSEARRKHAYSFVFQKPVLFDWRSVLDNVLLPLELAHLKRDERIERGLSALRMMGLERFASYRPWQLSSGLQQRVGLARALVTQPAVLFLDEPFGALDDMLREDLNAELADLCQRVGATALLVTHSVAEAVWLSDRVFVMHSGPGRIVDTVDVRLPRARTAALRESDAFFHTVVDVQHRLRAEAH
jgi:NitT/TauT family transport system ATP-binding protein